MFRTLYHRPGLHAPAEHVLELEIDSRPFRCVCAGRIGRCQEVAWRGRAQRRHGDGRREAGRARKGWGAAPLRPGVRRVHVRSFRPNPRRIELSVSKQRGGAQHIPAWRGRQGARFVSVKSEESEPCTGHVCESGIFPGTSSRRTSCSRWAEAIVRIPRRCSLGIRDRQAPGGSRPTRARGFGFGVGAASISEGI